MFASYSENEIRGNARPHPDPLRQERGNPPQVPGIFTPLGVASPQGNLREFIIAGPVNSPAQRWKSGQGWIAALLGLFLLVPSRLAIAGAPAAGVSASASKLAYNREIRPMLSENCFACHGPDKNQRKGKLRLDVREAAIEKKALVPGKPQESELVKRLYTTNADDLMPPPESHKKLTAQQKNLLERWIEQGAEYEPHWAYIPAKRPEVPQPRNRQGVRNPIDAFILQTLEAKGLEPSPEADRRTLLRRLSLDLIGLPPTPEEVAAFLRDSGSDAYQRQVDRLLDSPHFGERMAVPWLDVVRFSDTVGYHGDQNQRIFPYRDYVIASFNRNKPFDRFTIEQLAGDLLPDPTAEQLVATGFNRLNMMTREGGAQPKEYLAKYGADRVRTVSTTWLGSTMGCCECHDHKYDPFSTKDFYSMEAFFADLRQWGVYSDYTYTPNPDLKGWSNDHPFPPELEVDSFYLHLRQARLQERIDRLIESAANQWRTNPAGRAAFEDWRRTARAFLKQRPDGWVTAEPTVKLVAKDTNAAAETTFAIRTDRSIVFQGKPIEKTEIKLPLEPGWLAALRLELLPHDAHGGSIVRGDDESTTISFSAALRRANADTGTTVSFYHAAADHKEERYSDGFALIGVKDAWRTSKEARKSPQTAVWLLDQPVRISAGDILTLTLANHAIGRLRVSVTPFASQDPLKAGGGAALAQALEKGGNRQSALVSQTWLLGTGMETNAFGQFKKLNRELLECRNGRAFTMVSAASKPMVTRVLPRGNWQDESGEVVQPTAPHFLPQIPNPKGRRLTRLDLVQWLVSRDNPLTARTVMNRLWKQFFGTGISAVVDDLGAQGEWPTHPELLDWLAVEFMESGWDLKHMVKLMVVSSTYRQSSNPRPEIKETDPLNRLLASQSPRRLEAEFVRDNALFIAGLLNPDIGGPSAHPYQPAGYYANLQFPDRDYSADRDDRQYRRGVYTHWQRTFLHPMLANFDAPSREECVASRNISNTPQQALTLLNDPTFLEASRLFAQKLLAAKDAPDNARLDLAYEAALARPIKAKEERSLEQFLALQREHYRENPNEAKELLRIGIFPEPKGADETELAAWSQVCRVILNLHETITRY